MISSIDCRRWATIVSAVSPIQRAKGSRRFACEITVVIPVWDRYCAWVSDAVQSVLVDQGVTARGIVVDNACTVRLPELPRVVDVLRLSERVGSGPAMNSGLERVSSPFVLFLDADDRLLPGALSALREMLTDQDIVAACGRCLLVAQGSGGSVALGPGALTRAMARSRGLNSVHGSLRNRLPMAGCLLVRTATALDADGFGDLSLGEDWAFHVALGLRGRFAFTDRPTRLYGVHSNSVSTRMFTQAEAGAVYANVRRRLLNDPRTPGLTRRLMPLIALWHRRGARRLAQGRTRSATAVAALRAVESPGPEASAEREAG